MAVTEAPSIVTALPTREAEDEALRLAVLRLAATILRAANVGKPSVFEVVERLDAVSEIFARELEHHGN
jgi:hypothetical protein